MSEVVLLFISNILLLSYSLTANGPVLVRLETKTGFMQFLLQHVSLLHRFLSNDIYRQCINCRLPKMETSSVFMSKVLSHVSFLKFVLL